MKKLLPILFFVVITTNAFSQQPCQAYFTYSYNPAGNTISLYDNSYNIDSTQLNVTSWIWTVQYGGVSTTYSMQNPVIQLNAAPPSIYVCLQIGTLLCQSTYCDTIPINNLPQNSCTAAYNYQVDSMGNNIFFFDASTTNNGNITSWYWQVTNNTGIIGTSTLQNPSFPFPGNGLYGVCLTISTDSGCTANHCDSVYLQNANTCYTNFTYTMSNNTSSTYDFSGYAYFGGALINVASWLWDFGDGTTATIQNPTHTFVTPGTYTVCLTTTTTNTNCTSTYCANIVVPDTSCILTVTANISNVTVAGGNDGFIELTVTGGTPPYTFNWYNLLYTTQNIYNLTSGVYTVAISCSNPACPTVTYTCQILEPYDSTNVIVDTLYTNVLDTCFGYPVDSFYIDSIFISGNNTVTVVWMFVGGNTTTPIYVTYTYIMTGTQIIVLTINCDSGAKDMATYMGYIYISPTLGVDDNTNQQILNMYPNPVCDRLNIDFGTFMPAQSTIQIYSGSGQEVYNTILTEESKNIAIDVSQLKTGIYFIRTVDNKNKIITGKFIR